MPPVPHTSSCRSIELRLQTVPASGIGPETVYRELRQGLTTSHVTTRSPAFVLPVGTAVQAAGSVIQKHK
jgi:hypothetical protein